MATILSGVGTFRSFHKAAHSKRSVVQNEPKSSAIYLQRPYWASVFMSIHKSFLIEESEKGKEKRHTEKRGEEETVKLKKIKIKRGWAVSRWQLSCSISHRKQFDWTAFGITRRGELRHLGVTSTQVERFDPSLPPNEVGELEAGDDSFLSGEFSS